MKKENEFLENLISDKKSIQPVWNKMSHEIRTPMNAIMGLSELLLNKVTDAEGRECLHSIQIASRDLLMTINKIIDFENVMLGHIELNNQPFDLHDLLTEVVNITKINIGDNRVKFYVDIQPGFPKLLVADADRIKQIVDELLSNSTKFTKSGYVKLTVNHEVIGDYLKLTFVVEDTGGGIDEEETTKMFDIDNYDQNITGIGIGLSLIKELTSLLEGTLSIESKVNVGTTVTFSLDVKIMDPEPYEHLSNPESKHVAVFIEDKKESEILVKTIKALSVDVVALENMGQLFLQYPKKKFTHIFISHDKYIQIKDIKEVRDLGAILVVGIEYYKEWVYDDSAKFIRRPFWYRSIQKALNVSENYMHSKHINKVLVAKNARVLVVDDNDINLKVSVGLLRKYEISADTASSGEEAIRMVTKSYYDLVFMDYMMPEMDGIEATKRIRSIDDNYYRKLPIIALSANAVEGVGDLFLSGGMNDYMAKPIEREVLEKMLQTWLPEDKISYVKREVIDGKEEKNPFENFKFIDSESGLFYTNGDREMYLAIVKDFKTAISEKQELLNSLVEKDDIARFTIEVHSLKSTSKTIGAIALSDKALELERYGHKREADKIISELPNLNTQIDLVKEDLRSLFPDETVKQEKSLPKKKIIKELLRKLYYAADDFDYETAQNLYNEISSYKYDEKVDSICKDILKCIEDIDYEGTRMKAIEMLAYLFE